MVEPKEEKKEGALAPTYSSILDEHDVSRLQRDVRIKLLKELARKAFNNDKSPNGVVAHLSHKPLSSQDIPILGDVLRSIGDVEVLNVILHSPGGDGTVVEKFVALCRAQCKKFRIIIPNEAKSAATLISLGADEVVMCPPSELGPIDAQIEIVANGLVRYVSAQSFIDARDKLLKVYAEQTKKNEDTGATMQLLATLDLPFITECERMMEFGRDVAKKFLEQYMFRNSKDKSVKAKKAVDYLSSVKKHKVHGRIIDGSKARTELGLKVKLLGKNDGFWKKIWEYYTRVELHLARSDSSKIFETEHDMLMTTS